MQDSGRPGQLALLPRLGLSLPSRTPPPPPRLARSKRSLAPPAPPALGSQWCAGNVNVYKIWQHRWACVCGLGHTPVPPEACRFAGAPAQSRWCEPSQCLTGSQVPGYQIGGASPPHHTRSPQTHSGPRTITRQRAMPAGSGGTLGPNPHCTKQEATSSGAATRAAGGEHPGARWGHISPCQTFSETLPGGH